VRDSLPRQSPVIRRSRGSSFTSGSKTRVVLETSLGRDRQVKVRRRGVNHENFERRFQGYQRGNTEISCSDGKNMTASAAEVVNPHTGVELVGKL